MSPTAPNVQSVPRRLDRGFEITNPTHSLSSFLALSHREKGSDQNQASHHCQRNGKHRTVHATPQSQTLCFTGVVVGGTDEKRLQTVHFCLRQGNRGR